MTLVSETSHKQNLFGNHKATLNEKPTDSPKWFFIPNSIEQFSFEGKGNFAVYEKDYRNVWTSRKNATDAISWIASDNPTKISPNYTKLCECLDNQPINITTRFSGSSRELKIETFSGRRRPEWQSKPGTEVAVASLQNSNIKIAVNSGGRRLGRLPKRKIWLHIKN